jgi:DNA-binding NtrC family response regulator
MPKSTILVVDDESAVLRALSKILTMENYNVLTAPDGLCAMEIMKENQHKIHLVITNIKMPKLDGFELIEQMSSVLHHPMSVIINSGCCGTVRRDHLKLGTAENILLYDIFQKPPNLLEFSKSIEEAIGLTRNRRQSFIENDMTMYLSYN